MTFLCFNNFSFFAEFCGKDRNPINLFNWRIFLFSLLTSQQWTSEECSTFITYKPVFTAFKMEISLNFSLKLTPSHYERHANAEIFKTWGSLPIKRSSYYRLMLKNSANTLLFRCYSFKLAKTWKEQCKMK